MWLYLGNSHTCATELREWQHKFFSQILMYDTLSNLIKRHCDGISDGNLKGSVWRLAAFYG